jgi:hypothetical protein
MIRTLFVSMGELNKGARRPKGVGDDLQREIHRQLQALVDGLEDRLGGGVVVVGLAAVSCPAPTSSRPPRPGSGAAARPWRPGTCRSSRRPRQLQALVDGLEDRLGGGVVVVGLAAVDRVGRRPDHHAQPAGGGDDPHPVRVDGRAEQGRPAAEGRRRGAAEASWRSTGSRPSARDPSAVAGPRRRPGGSPWRRGSCRGSCRWAS